MALDIDISHYNTGTATVDADGTAVTGQGTTWTVLRKGDLFGTHIGMPVRIAEINSDTSLTLAYPWKGPAQTAAPYEIQRTPYDTGYLAAIEELLRRWGGGNVDALAELEGLANRLPIFTGPGTMALVPRTDLISGANYDVQVADLAARAEYDGRPGPTDDAPGFAVLVADTGDGRAAIYSKLSDASGDWSDPAYVTGPVGPEPDLQAGTASRGPLGMSFTPVGAGYELDLTIPTQAAQGDYSGATAYITGDIVQQNGSSWVALQDTTGNAPPSLPTTGNAFWQLLARAGMDGAGIVTTVVAGDGIDIDSTDPTAPEVSVVPFTGDSGIGGALGGVPAPSAGDAAAGKVLGASGGWVEVQAAGEVSAKTANYTVVAADDGNVITVDASGAAGTITLLPAATAGNGFKLIVKKSDSSANTVTIDGDGSETIDGATTKVLRLPHQSVALICDGTVWHVMGEGSVFERGSNANGDYVRFADGTQICQMDVTLSSSGTVSKTLPAAFANTTFSAFGTSTTNTSTTLFVYKTNIVTASSIDVVAVSSAGYVAPSGARWMAIGEWF